MSESMFWFFIGAICGFSVMWAITTVFFKHKNIDNWFEDK